MVRSTREAAQAVIRCARQGLPMPEEAITWALQVSGDVPGPAWATAELWDFLASIEREHA
jgi:hypothetical protein